MKVSELAEIVACELIRASQTLGTPNPDGSRTLVEPKAIIFIHADLYSSLFAQGWDATLHRMMLPSPTFNGHPVVTHYDNRINDLIIHTYI